MSKKAHAMALRLGQPIGHVMILEELRDGSISIYSFFLKDETSADDNRTETYKKAIHALSQGRSVDVVINGDRWFMWPIASREAKEYYAKL